MWSSIEINCIFLYFGICIADPPSPNYGIFHNSFFKMKASLLMNIYEIWGLLLCLCLTVYHFSVVIHNEILNAEKITGTPITYIESSKFFSFSTSQGYSWIKDFTREQSFLSLVILSFNWINCNLLWTYTLNNDLQVAQQW